MEPSVMKAQNAQFVWACIATCHICKSSYIATMFMTDDNLLANTAQFTFYYCTCILALSLHFCAVKTPYSVQELPLMRLLDYITDCMQVIAIYS